MLPESMAPPLENYDEFKEFMAKRDVRVMRDYVDPGPSTAKVSDFAEEREGFWQVVMWKEWPMPDGRIWSQAMCLNDEIVIRKWQEAWELEANLLDEAGRVGMTNELIKDSLA